MRACANRLRAHKKAVHKFGHCPQFGCCLLLVPHAVVVSDSIALLTLLPGLKATVCRVLANNVPAQCSSGAASTGKHNSSHCAT